ncbi:TetR/AcrR family transcriptional regulator [Leucobacter sp. NPDC058333]|uniref:TetR/AcrR family transcriptional regulator n=1 Tax=Leucobacter sp. NPDC058333 TaxID=3346450 RepID=UPI0036638FBC
MRVPVASRRRALIDAALVVISRDGLAAATTRAIVAEAGMSLASLHYAFPSRDALLEAVIDLVVEQEREAVMSALAAPSFEAPRPDLGTVLRDGLGLYLATIDRHPGREHGMLEFTLHAARSGSPAAALQYLKYEGVVAELLIAAAEASGMRWKAPVSELAILVIALSDGLTISRIVHGDVPAVASEVLVTALMTQAEPDPEVSEA